MNNDNWQETISELSNQRWLDRKSRVVFVEMTHMNPVTYWFVFLISLFFETLSPNKDIKVKNITQVEFK